jgi:putative ABC transport system substrate-binding protein
LAVACGQAAERPVPVFASPDSPRLRQTLAGLEEGLAPRRLAVAVVPAVGESGPETLRRLRAAGPPLFVVLGTPALIMLAQVEKRIPALFAMVANPYFSDAAWDPKRPEFHSRNVTGLASPPPVAQALRQGTGLLGRRAWGLLYDPLDGAALEVARAFEAAAAELGLRSLMETSSEAGQDLEALERLRSRGAQVFYLPPTATASRYAPHLLAWGRQRRVLVVSGHPEVEPQGAILSVTLDYHALGREAAALARRLLAGESPAGIPIRETQPLAIQADHALIRHWSGYPAPLQGK